MKNKKLAFFVILFTALVSISFSAFGDCGVAKISAHYTNALNQKGFIQSGTGVIFNLKLKSEENVNVILSDYHVVAEADRINALCESNVIELEIVTYDSVEDWVILKIRKPPNEDTSNNLRPLFEINQSSLNQLSLFNKNRRSNLYQFVLFSPYFQNYIEEIISSHSFFSFQLSPQLPYYKTQDDVGLILNPGHVFEMQSDLKGKKKIDGKYPKTAEELSFKFNDDGGFYLSGIATKPGMSGSPLIGYFFDSDGKFVDQFLIGLVSHTLMDGSASRLIRADNIIKVLIDPSFELYFKNSPISQMQNRSLIVKDQQGEKGIQYQVDFENELVLPYLVDNNGTRYFSKCSTKFNLVLKESFDHTAGGKGDWGSNGDPISSVLNSREYYHDKFYDFSIYIPQRSCAETGLFDSKGHHWLLSKVDYHILEFSDLLNLISVNSANKNIKDISMESLIQLNMIEVNNNKEMIRARNQLCEKIRNKEIFNFKVVGVHLNSDDKPLMTQKKMDDPFDVLTNSAVLKCQHSKSDLEFKIDFENCKSCVGKNFLNFQIDQDNIIYVNGKIGSCDISLKDQIVDIRTFTIENSNLSLAWTLSNDLKLDLKLYNIDSKCFQDASHHPWSSIHIWSDYGY